MLNREILALEPRELPSAAFESLPVIPSLDTEVLANLRTIAQIGRNNGLRSDVFVQAGDSNSATPNFLRNLATPATTSGVVNPDLAETLQVYRAPISNLSENSFNRRGYAAVPGFTSVNVAQTIALEIQATRASIAYVMIGTNDTALVDYHEYRRQIATIVDQVTSHGVIPILSTIPQLMYHAPSSNDAAAARNQAIVDIAHEKKVPVLNLWNGLANLPLFGLGADFVHMNVSPNGSGALGPIDLLYGQNLRANLLLQTLTEIREKVFNYDPVLEAARIQSYWNALEPGVNYLVTGSEAGQPAVITVTDATTGERLAQIKPFESSFLGGVRVAAGDLNGDGITDIVAAAGSGGGPAVKVYSGKTGEVLHSFFAYEPSFRGGVTVSVGDENSDGVNELAIGSGVGGGPRVRIFTGPELQLVRDFLALDPNFRGGINVAIGQFGLATSAGNSGGPIIQLFDPGATQSRTAFFAYESAFRGGVNLAVADLNGDGQQELITAPGPSGGAHIRIWNLVDAQEIGGFLAAANFSREGYRVAGVPGQIVVGSNTGPNQPIRTYRQDGQLIQSLGMDHESWMLNGAYVAGS